MLPHLVWLSAEGVLALDLTKPAKKLPVLRIDLPKEIISDWTALTARLLVLDMDAARRSGAGAITIRRKAALGR
jgi:hypothetical protein